MGRQDLFVRVLIDRLADFLPELVFAWLSGKLFLTYQTFLFVDVCDFELRKNNALACSNLANFVEVLLPCRYCNHNLLF